MYNTSSNAAVPVQRVFTVIFFPRHVAVRTKCTATENPLQSLSFSMVPATSDAHGKEARSFMKVHSTVMWYGMQWSFSYESVG